MVIRIPAVPDSLLLHEFDAVQGFEEYRNRKRR